MNLNLAFRGRDGSSDFDCGVLSSFSGGGGALVGLDFDFGGEAGGLFVLGGAESCVRPWRTPSRSLLTSKGRILKLELVASKFALQGVGWRSLKFKGASLCTVSQDIRPSGNRADHVMRLNPNVELIGRASHAFS